MYFDYLITKGISALISPCSEEESVQLQELLFKYGYHWNDKRQIPKYTHSPCLFIPKEDSYLTYSNTPSIEHLNKINITDDLRRLLELQPYEYW